MEHRYNQIKSKFAKANDYTTYGDAVLGCDGTLQEIEIARRKYPEANPKIFDYWKKRFEDLKEEYRR